MPPLRTDAPPVPLEAAVPERKRWRPALLLAIVAIAPYLLLPAHPLLLDAQRAVAVNPLIASGTVGEILHSDYWGLPPDAPYGTRSYRPLVSLSWAWQVRTFGSSERIFHLLDMGLHALNTVLVVMLLGALAPDSRWRYPAALLFAVHPVLTEAVCSVVGRADLMAAGCLLGALALHWGNAARAPRPIRTAGAILLLGAALYCKEYAVAFPIVLIAGDVALTTTGRHPARRGHRIAVWSGAVAMLALYLFVRVAIFGALGGVPMLDASDQPLVDATLPVRLGTAAWIYVHAARLLLLPVGLNAFYHGHGTIGLAGGIADPRSLAGLGLLAGAFALAIGAAARRREPLPAVAVALILLPLAPALNVVSVAGVLFAERYLYIPAAGAAVLVAWACGRLLGPDKRPSWAVALTALLVVAGGAATAKRVGEWRSVESLARSALRAYPESSEAWLELGLQLGARGDHEQARAAFRRSLQSYEPDPKVWRNLGLAELQLGRAKEAATAFRRVLELSPSDIGVLWSDLGRAELADGRYEEAVNALRRAQELPPSDPRGAAALGQALLRLAQRRLADGDSAGAKELAGEAIGLPGLPPAGVFLAGLVFHHAGDDVSARRLFDDALDRDPELLRRRHEQALELQEEGRHSEAIELFEEILAARPAHVPTLFNTGRAYLLAGRPDAAIETLRRGLALQDDPGARALLANARKQAAERAASP